MNIMLILAVLFALFKIADGYKKGIVKEIVSLVTLGIMGIFCVIQQLSSDNFATV